MPLWVDVGAAAFDAGDAALGAGSEAAFGVGQIFAGGGLVPFEPGLFQVMVGVDVGQFFDGTLEA